MLWVPVVSFPGKCRSWWKFHLSGPEQLPFFEAAKCLEDDPFHFGMVDLQGRAVELPGASIFYVCGIMTASLLKKGKSHLHVGFFQSSDLDQCDHVTLHSTSTKSMAV